MDRSVFFRCVTPLNPPLEFLTGSEEAVCPFFSDEWMEVMGGEDHNFLPYPFVLFTACD